MHNLHSTSKALKKILHFTRFFSRQLHIEFFFFKQCLFSAFIKAFFRIFWPTFIIYCTGRVVMKSVHESRPCDTMKTIWHYGPNYSEKIHYGLNLFQKKMSFVLRTILLFKEKKNFKVFPVPNGFLQILTSSHSPLFEQLVVTFAPSFLFFLNSECDYYRFFNREIFHKKKKEKKVASFSPSQQCLKEI